MTERAILIGGSPGLVGVLSVPESEAARAETCVLFLNAGMIHRIGPHRLYVETARRLASVGIPSLRLDFSGIGDTRASTSSLPLLDRYMDEACTAMDFLSRTIGSRSFLPVGICSGANAAFLLVEKDERVVGGTFINGSYSSGQLPVTEREKKVATDHAAKRSYRRRLMSPRSWTRLFTGRSNYGAILRVLKRALMKPFASRRRGTFAADVCRSLEKMSLDGKEVLMVHSDGSLTWDLLDLDGGDFLASTKKLTNVELVVLPECDHVLTPMWAQERMVDAVVAWASRVVTNSEPAHS